MIYSKETDDLEERRDRNLKSLKEGNGKDIIFPSLWLLKITVYETLEGVFMQFLCMFIVSWGHLKAFSMNYLTECMQINLQHCKSVSSILSKYFAKMQSAIAFVQELIYKGLGGFPLLEFTTRDLAVVKAKYSEKNSAIKGGCSSCRLFSGIGGWTYTVYRGEEVGRLLSTAKSPFDIRLWCQCAPYCIE